MSKNKFNEKAAKDIIGAWMSSVIKANEKYTLTSEDYFHTLGFCMCVFLSKAAFTFFPDEHKDQGFTLIDDIANHAKEMLTDRISKNAN